MEEAKSRPGFPGDRAQVAAEKLRALRERANQALDDHRKRLAQIETELSDRVRQLAEEFETAAEGIEKHLPGSRDAEVAALREQLEENRAKHEKFVEQLSIARKQIDAIQSEPCPACDDAAQQLADAQAEIRQQREQLARLEQEREEDRSRNEKVAEQVAAARQAIGDLQARSSEQTSQLQIDLDEATAARDAAEKRATAALNDLESLQAEYAKLEQQAQSQEKIEAAIAEERRLAGLELDKVQANLAASERSLQESQSALAAAHLQAEAVQDEASGLADANAKLLAEQAALTAQLTAAEQEANQLRTQLTSEDSELQSLKTLLAEATAARDEMQAAVEAAHSQIDALEQEAAASVPELERQFEQFQMEVEAAETARASVLAALDATKAELAALKETTCPRADLDALQHKFGLTLSEVQKLKRENEELREAVTAAPGAATPSPDLIALRQERDSLAERVAQLESMPAPAPAAPVDDSAIRQQMEDLQHRFEMTLDDLRKANQVNHELRGQLAAAQSAAPAASHSGGTDWASQRARLMAMLEDEDCEGVTEPARKKERATIEETIAATDRAMAEKERELAELRTVGVAISPDDEEQRAKLAAVDADELIVAEREKLVTLQAEWEEKVRKAELEFALERAKLARDQAALKEKMLEFQKTDPQGILANDADGKPRRRWLAALGLGEEGDEGGKSKG